jgi:SNF2 family DNA or RNA helicase
MHKYGDVRDTDRRRKHVSELQDGEDWKDNRILPEANAKWPTCLIICPAPVVGNWQREFETWGYFELGFFTGERNERREVLRDFKMGRLDVCMLRFIFSDLRTESSVVITTPALARKDIDLIFDLPFSIIIVDEVHNVKNPLSKTSKAFNSFDCLIRFGLTGTAIQNDYMELWTILDWTHPGMLGSKKQWRGFVANPLKAGQSRGSSEDVRAKAVVSAHDDQLEIDVISGP